MTKHEPLVYSPVNWLAVEWGDNGKKFPLCGLPHPRPKQDSISIHSRCPCPDVTPVQATITTYDWERWLPEIIVGVDDPTEEIAADFARAAAIEFCKQTRALQRDIVIPLERGEHVYPIPSVSFENVIGIIGARVNGVHCGCRENCWEGEHPDGVRYLFDMPRAELHVHAMGHCCHHGGKLAIRVWAAPKEYACEYDSFLYEFFRNEITLMARHNYVRNVHFRDTALLHSLVGRTEIDRLWALAKLRALSSNTAVPAHGNSGLFGNSHRASHRWR
ncbi:MAG: hypothetical protein NC080_07400 [Paraprevotella sp.]|nr:hypothetical protein [Paraprevotella sp.]